MPPLADQWRPLSDHCGDHCASIRRPRQTLSHLGSGSASIMPPLCDLPCHYSTFGRSMKAQRSCCSSYTETELSRLGRPLSFLTIFWSLKGGTKVTALCKRGFTNCTCLTPRLTSHSTTPLSAWLFVNYIFSYKNANFRIK